MAALAYCVKADDDNDGVTLKDYEFEESGEYADCYHKTTQNCTSFCIVVRHVQLQPTRCMECFFDI